MATWTKKDFDAAGVSQSILWVQHWINLRRNLAARLSLALDVSGSMEGERGLRRPCSGLSALILGS